ncbi:MAG: hypothetical protein AAFP78_04605, partial [Pseudomonadota bacterium]
ASPPVASATPRTVAAGAALVGPDNTDWDAETATLRPRFAFPPIMKSHQVSNDREGALAELQRIVARGGAAGNVGDLYDNRDDDHSALPIEPRSQLTRVIYGEDARAAGLHYGLNEAFLFDTPTFGNSSTALTGAVWRSQPRFALTSPGGARRLARLYEENHIYVFPAHRDFDARFGDLFPALTPYALISRGSSGSDRPLLRAVQVALAALRPETKARLIEERLIAPMIQQIIRRSIVPDRAAYLSPAAHPTAIPKDAVDLARVIELAQAVAVDEIPPLVTLKVLREAPPDASVFADGLDETLFSTPSAVARLWRGAPSGRIYELEAAAEDPNQRNVSFHWRVISGDPSRIRIDPLNDAGDAIRLSVGWQSPTASPSDPDVLASRIDIAVFADNGAQLSAPAFFSLALPSHQERDYADDGRPLRIAHKSGPGAPYADPLIWPRRGWEDAFTYNASGALTGWTRARQGDPEGPARYTAQGLFVEKTDARGNPTVAREVRYPVRRIEDGATEVVPTPGGLRFAIEYDGIADTVGRAVPLRD